MPIKAGPAVIGAGLDLGAGRRGVDMGPSAIRYAGLDSRIASLGRQLRRLGRRDHPDPRVDTGRRRERPLPAGDHRDLQARRAARRAGGGGGLPAARPRRRPLGRDRHARRARAPPRPGGVLWIDAHGDLNRPDTSPSGNVHGMPLAAALGVAGPRFDTDAWPVPSVERAALVGVRASRPGERRSACAGWRRASVVHDERGRPDRPSAPCASRSRSSPARASCTSASTWTRSIPRSRPVSGRRCAAASPIARRTWRWSSSRSRGSTSLDVVEVNPVLDRENATGKLAVELVASALGARIL